MKCLIIAAGLGSRLRPKAKIKPLAPIADIPLIERVIRSARMGGVSEFFVVSGYRGRELRAFLDELSRRESIPLQHIVNEHWERPNGWSVLAAEGVLQETFILSMSDHIYDPALVSELIAHGHDGSGVTLAVDRRLENPQVDLEDVTCVYAEDGKIKRIGKVIKKYNAFDTGVFLCTPDIFAALRESIEERKDGSLSGGVRVLAERGQAYVHDIGDKFWLDVDDPEDYSTAQTSVLEKIVHTQIF